MYSVIRGLYGPCFQVPAILDTRSSKVKETIPSLADLGGHQLYPADPSVGEYSKPTPHTRALIFISLDRRPALLSILRSLLVTYSNLTAAILAPPPSPHSTVPPEWQRHVEWITVLAQNLMAAANDLRPVQVGSFSALPWQNTHTIT